MIESRSGNNILTFDEEKHIYKLNGDIVNSVTTINKLSLPESPRLAAWKVGEGVKYAINSLSEFPQQVNKLPDYLLEEITKKSKAAWMTTARKAANIGTIIHDYAEQFEFKGKIDEELHEKIKSHKDKAKILSCIKKFRRWKIQNKDTILRHEEILASVLYGFAGKFDRLSNRNGLIVLSDFKTSSGFFIDQFIQLAAYVVLLKEWLNIDVDVIEIIRFGKEDGEFEVKQVKDKKEIKELQKQFIRGLETYKFMKEHENA